MRIGQVHNTYQNPTGDDAVVIEERNLLMSRGHDVSLFAKTNKSLDKLSLFGKVSMALSLRSSATVKYEFNKFLKDNQPDVVHAHNLFPLITPVIFEVCKAQGIPVIQTLHNYRLVCVNTLFYRDGHLCEDCLDSSLKAGVKHKCYNGSKIQSYLMADAIDFHRRKNSWNTQVDAFICLSEFARTKFIKGGILPEKLIIKPNFVHDPVAKIEYEDFFLFAGKLEEQKGLNDFLELASQSQKIKFKVAGYCAEPKIFESLQNVEFLGQIERSELMKLMAKCKGVLFLSRMYEGMPMTILEAFSLKKPVIARNLGAMREMIQDRKNGLLFSSMTELLRATEKLQSQEVCNVLGKNAYNSFQKYYSEELAYKNLMDIYHKVQTN